VKVLKYLLTIFFSIALIGCASTDDQPLADTGEQQIYEDAQRYLGNGNFDLAVKSLQLLESRYPFGRYAEQAQLELIYAHFGAYEHEAAVEAANRFIRLHPQHPNIDYAYYMKGLAAYTGNEDIFARFLPTDLTKRDTSHAREAFAEFAQLLSRYPDSPYAADAKARMVSLRNMLSRNEINVANYYLRRGAFLAATNRGRYVVENFQRTPAVADGLAVMAQGYILLGMDDLAQDTIDGLQRSWINKASFGLFDPPQPPQFDNRQQL
jgi:outer membrane protein assembly factor BamD